MTTPVEDAAKAAYAPAAIALHWMVFLLVVAVGWLGLLHDSWPRTTQAYWINIHAMLGLLMFALVLARIAWRMQHPAPPLPADVGAAVRFCLETDGVTGVNIVVDNGSLVMS